MKTVVRSIVWGAVWAAAAALPWSAAAQELRIGYVNSERVLREAAPAKAAQVRLEGEFGKRERDLAEQAQRLKSAAGVSVSWSSRTATSNASAANSRKT